MRWFTSAPKATGFVVSIGAGINQIPLIKEAKNAGFQVIGVDANAHAPGFLSCDLKIQESIDNHEQIYTILREFLLDAEIRAIMTKSYGAAIKTVAYIAERFNTPFMPLEHAESFVDKERMKRYFLDAGILTPPLVQAATAARSKGTHYPLIMKPTIGHAKSGVRLIGSPADLPRSKKPPRGAPAYILERYLPGDEIIAIGAVHNHRYHLIEMTDKELLTGTFIDVAHRAPTRFEDMAEAVAAAGQAVADAFHISTAPLVTEFVVHEGRPYLIEAVPEFGGEFLTDVLIPARRGYNLVAEMIKAATGLGFTPPQPRRRYDAVVVRYITGTPGTLVSLNPEAARSVEGIIFTRVFKEIGADIRRPQSNHDRIGVVAAAAPTIDEANRRAARAIEALTVTIR